MSNFKAQLEKYFLTKDSLPKWDRNVPDELCAQISTLEDFREFVSFVDRYLGTEALEYGCEDTSEFIARVGNKLDSADLKKRAAEKEIKSDFGRLALAMILAIGN